MSSVLIDGESLYLAALAILDSVSPYPNRDSNTIAFLFSDPKDSNDKITDVQKDDRLFPQYVAKANIYEALVNLVYCIILWDEVCVFEEKMISHYLAGAYYFAELGVEFKELSGRSTTGEALKKYKDDNLPYKFDPYKLYGNGLSGLSPSRRAMTYYMYANANGLDYMPSMERQKLLLEHEGISVFYRNDVIDKLDEQLREYYAKVNRLFPHSRVTYRFPVIVDYLMQKYTSISDVFKAAYDLKNQQETIRFRSELDVLSAEFRKGNIQYIEEYFLNLEHLLSDLQKTYSMDHSMEVAISLRPSLTYSKDGNKIKPFQSIFLNNLLRYGMNNRTPQSLLLTNIPS